METKIKIDEFAKRVKMEFEGFREILKRKGIDFQPTEMEWKDFTARFLWITKDFIELKDSIKILEQKEPFIQKTKMEEVEITGEVKMTGWVARDANGLLLLHFRKPVREDALHIFTPYWYSGKWGAIKIRNKNAFKALRWEDEPVKVKVTIRAEEK